VQLVADEQISHPPAHGTQFPAVLTKNLFGHWQTPETKVNEFWQVLQVDPDEQDKQY